jgi:hypothetical protein
MLSGKPPAKKWNLNSAQGANERKEIVKCYDSLYRAVDGEKVDTSEIFHRLSIISLNKQNSWIKVFSSFGDINDLFLLSGSFFRYQSHLQTSFRKIESPRYS